MKKLNAAFFGKAICALAASLLTPSASNALDWTPDASRVVSDPSYLPLQGQLYGSTDYEYERATRDNYFLGTKNYSFTQTEQLLNQSLAYGITDDLTAEVSGTYIPRDKQEEQFPLGRNEYHFQGLEDPTLSLTWRALDERTAPVNVDFTASYSPDVVGNRYATSVSSGTVGEGRDSGSLGAAVSYKTRSFTIEALGGATYVDSGNYEVPTDNMKGDEDPYWAYYVGLQTQTRLTDVFSINAGYRYTTFSHEGITTPGGLAYDEGIGDEHNFDVALNYHIIPNRLVAGITYNNILHNHTSDSYAIPFFDSENKNEDANIFGVRLQYVFF